jgi:flavorubredoxin
MEFVTISFLKSSFLHVYRICLGSGASCRDFKNQAVKGGDKVDLGGGHVMEFVMAPNLHWPDTMFSYDHATGVMYTCDAFGMHYCTEEPFDTDVQAIMPHYR